MKSILSICIVLPLLAACAHDASSGSERRYDAERCEQLRQQIDDLRARPQRRKAASDRYQIECLGNR